ncbi:MULTISPECIES: serine hydrolase [Streptomyces]|uniref:Serine hydrolase n=1 Tax=Streptomyces pratisoli TaxID=3139917 RepID=A0ACC6QSJ8_9ACTN|nr:serine hydrolase [Streptomyces sp. NBC_00259]
MGEGIPEQVGGHGGGSRALHPVAHRLVRSVAGTAVVLAVGATVAAAYGAAHAGNGAGRTAEAAASVTTAAPSPSPTPSRSMSPSPSAAPSPSPAVDLATVLAPVAAEADGGLSVAVRDSTSGRSAVYGEEAFDSASIAKVNILATLLLQAQDEGRELTALEKSRAVTMIENSDNAAALALWRAIGRAEGLEVADERFGMTSTRGGAGDLWGLTQTTAADQLALLDVVFGDSGSPLTAASRAYVSHLMGNVSAGQDWGVSAAASTGSEGAGTALKNGWLPRSATGLWVINSVGRIEADGRTYLVAVLSDGNRSKQAGVGTVEDAARAAVAAVGVLSGR